MSNIKCPRCKGLIVQERDQNGEYVHCLNCGWLKDLSLLPEHQSPGHGRSVNPDNQTPKAQDTGCEVSPSCLECPLDTCKYDDASTYQQLVQLKRNRQVREMVQESGECRLVAESMGLSVRTVQRIMGQEHYA